jgi:hypothetical protein
MASIQHDFDSLDFPLAQARPGQRLSEEDHVIEPVEGKIASVAVSGFYLRPEWLWRQPLPDVISLLGELLT